MESTEISFKSRKSKLNIRKRKTEQLDNDSDNEPEVAESISDILELRKLKQRTKGTQAETLSKGNDNLIKEEEKEKEEVTSGVKVSKLQNFTHQTNFVDVDKHMMKYIEEEMERKKKLNQDNTETNEDSQDNGTSISNQVRQTNNDGSVLTSISMLSGIQEVDLGIESRLKNIEQTEKAKRDLLLQKNEKPKDVLEGVKTYHSRGKANQHDTNYNTGATDSQVMDQFKKRMRKQ